MHRSCFIRVAKSLVAASLLLSAYPVHAQDMEVSITVTPGAPLENEIGGYYLSRDIGQFKVGEYFQGSNLTTLMLTYRASLWDQPNTYNWRFILDVPYTMSIGEGTYTNATGGFDDPVIYNLNDFQNHLDIEQNTSDTCFMSVSQFTISRLRLNRAGNDVERLTGSLDLHCCNSGFCSFTPTQPLLHADFNYSKCLTMDFNHNFSIDIGDLAQMLTEFGVYDPHNRREDLNMDGSVNLTDLSTLLARFGTNCPH